MPFADRVRDILIHPSSGHYLRLWMEFSCGNPAALFRWYKLCRCSLLPVCEKVTMRPVQALACHPRTTRWAAHVAKSLYGLNYPLRGAIHEVTCLHRHWAGQGHRSCSTAWGVRNDGHKARTLPAACGAV